MNIVAIGLCFDIAGTWCLAYEIVWGYKKRNVGEIARLQYYHIEKHINRMIDQIHAYSDEVYSSSDKLRLVEEMRKKWQPDLEEKRRIMNLGAHHHRSFVWALLGAVFLTIGFILQLSAVLG